MALAKISNNTNDGLKVETMNTPISPPTYVATGSDMTAVVGTTNQTSSLTTGTRIKTLIPPLSMFSWCGNLLKKLPSGRFEIQKSIAKSETQTETTEDWSKIFWQSSAFQPWFCSRNQFPLQSYTEGNGEKPCGNTNNDDASPASYQVKLTQLRRFLRQSLELIHRRNFEETKSHLAPNNISAKCSIWSTEETSSKKNLHDAIYFCPTLELLCRRNVEQMKYSIESTCFARICNPCSHCVL